MEEIRVRVLIEGLVQGVFFRASTQEEARALRLRGCVRNNQDGTVEAIFEGREVDINAMIEWCGIGPPGARVTNVNVAYEEFKSEFTDFLVDTAF
jgi:acylphosphatase